MSEASGKYLTVPQAVAEILTDDRIKANQVAYKIAYDDAFKMLSADGGENSLIAKSDIESYINRALKDVG